MTMTGCPNSTTLMCEVGEAFPGEGGVASSRCFPLFFPLLSVDWEAVSWLLADNFSPALLVGTYLAWSSETQAKPGKLSSAEGWSKGRGSKRPRHLPGSPFQLKELELGPLSLFLPSLHALLMKTPEAALRHPIESFPSPERPWVSRSCFLLSWDCE